MVSHTFRFFPYFFLSVACACCLRLKRWRREIFSANWQRCTGDVHAFIIFQVSLPQPLFGILKYFSANCADTTFQYNYRKWRKWFMVLFFYRFQRRFCSVYTCVFAQRPIYQNGCRIVSFRPLISCDCKICVNIFYFLFFLNITLELEKRACRPLNVLLWGMVQWVKLVFSFHTPPTSSRQNMFQQ